MNYGFTSVQARNWRNQQIRFEAMRSNTLQHFVFDYGIIHV